LEDRKEEKRKKNKDKHFDYVIFFLDWTAVVNEVVTIVVVAAIVVVGGGGGGGDGVNALCIISSKILSESGNDDPPRHCSVNVTNVK